jgi:hypothetical protein
MAGPLGGGQAVVSHLQSTMLDYFPTVVNYARTSFVTSLPERRVFSGCSDQGQCAVFNMRQKRVL